MKVYILDNNTNEILYKKKIKNNELKIKGKKFVKKYGIRLVKFFLVGKYLSEKGYPLVINAESNIKINIKENK